MLPPLPCYQGEHSDAQQDPCKGDAHPQRRSGLRYLHSRPSRSQDRNAQQKQGRQNHWDLFQRQNLLRHETKNRPTQCETQFCLVFQYRQTNALNQERLLPYRNTKQNWDRVNYRGRLWILDSFPPNVNEEGYG